MFDFSVKNLDRHSFQPTVCFVCAKKATDCALKTCSGCKLLVYCSSAHQATHWPHHKRFCRAIRAVALKVKCAFLFETAFASELLWRKYRVTILLGLHKELGRPLSGLEENIIITPNCCTVCHKYEKSMKTCHDCSSVWYCCDEHRLQDATKHRELCEEFSILLKLHIDNIITKEIIRGRIVTSNELPDCSQSFTNSLVQEDVCRGRFVTSSNKFPDSSEVFFDNLVQLETFSSYLGEQLSKIRISDSFTYQLTTIYALKQCQMMFKHRDFVIHVVGAQDMEASNVQLWEYLLCLDILNNFDNICLVLVGPSLKSELCNSKIVSRFEFKVRNACYHEFYWEENVKSRPPDLIIAFNCGFHEFSNSSPGIDTWKESIPYFCKHPNTVIVFTSYTRSEAKKDFDYFIENCACKDLEILVKQEFNPFRSLKPNYDWEESHNSAFFYFNNFISIFRTK